MDPIGNLIEKRGEEKGQKVIRIKAALYLISFVICTQLHLAYRISVLLDIAVQRFSLSLGINVVHVLSLLPKKL